MRQCPVQPCSPNYCTGHSGSDISSQHRVSVRSIWGTGQRQQKDSQLGWSMIELTRVDFGTNSRFLDQATI